MKKRIKVLLVDDHIMFRKGMKQLLALEDDIHAYAEASNGNEAVLVCRYMEPDVVLLDISMPEMGGLESIRLLKNEFPDIKIIILSMHGKELFVHEALKAGAAGYLLKGDDSEELPIAIRNVFRNGFYFSKKLHASLVSKYIGEHQQTYKDELSAFESLSEREKEYFLLVVKGYNSSKISEILEISQKTCQKHQANIYKKLNTKTSIGLLRYAIKLGYLDPDTF
ncbi:MAG: response regulator transcription factor [Deltaproteobacteria bacterium]|jgi:two-component system response regulator NreC|nr:response regulator transcription factor [Deltaproteobacteria bacterium]MBW2475760.1 response regulator transcription factor [Deltaproteobacteria bacterium]MBW2504089.1 response regulator transcription factor [Deltaproteobacteria bacterium]MBW2520177.1 response regulator transcription factor [Deltaproteobacteria bacterium]